MTARKQLTTLDKLKVMARYVRCPGLVEKNHKCGKPLGTLDKIDFDHIQALCRGGDNELSNFRPLCKDCHAIKTNGTGATTLGSDEHESAKTQRLENERNGKPKTKAKGRSKKIQSRGFDKTRTRGFDGEVRPRA